MSVGDAAATTGHRTIGGRPIAERLRLLAQPTRIGLVDRLEVPELSVHELSDEFGSTQHNVSKHLGRLLHAELVTRRPLGREALYACLLARSGRPIELAASNRGPTFPTGDVGP